MNRGEPGRDAERGDAGADCGSRVATTLYAALPHSPYWLAALAAVAGLRWRGGGCRITWNMGAARPAQRAQAGTHRRPATQPQRKPCSRRRRSTQAASSVAAADRGRAGNSEGDSGPARGIGQSGPASPPRHRYRPRAAVSDGRQPVAQSDGYTSRSKGRGARKTQIP